MKNSFGQAFKKGDVVKCFLPRGGNITGEIKSFETRGSYSKSYGKRVILSSGYSIGLNDCVLIN
jgi:hypothetical protein